jgi:hypothetical protein
MADESSTVWVPVCCGRVMRCNLFRQAGGAVLAALVCTMCSKNITLEQEPLGEPNQYGEGTNLLRLLGAPKPPKTDRRQAARDSGTDEPTL